MEDKDWDILLQEEEQEEKNKKLPTTKTGICYVRKKRKENAEMKICQKVPTTKTGITRSCQRRRLEYTISGRRARRMQRSR